MSTEARETAATTQAQETAQPAPEETQTQGKPTDAEAQLLKEVMALKKRVKDYESSEAKRQAAAEAEQKKRLAEEGKYKELLEQTQSELQATRDRAKQADIKAACVAAGVDQRFVRLLDSSTVEYAEDGSLTGLDAAIEALVTEYPEARKSEEHAQIPGTSRPGTPGKSSGVSSWDDFLKLTPIDRKAWMQRNPVAYEALRDKQINRR